MEKLRQVMTTVTAITMLVMMMIDMGGSTCMPPEEEIKLEEAMFYSDVVVFGRVERLFPEEAAQVYNAQMTVFCIYKGQNVPRMINISEAGELSDPCPELQMEVGSFYLAYLYKHGDSVFTPSYPHHPDNYKHEIFTLCDYNVSIPSGPEPVDQGDVKCEDDRPEYEADDDDYYYEEEPCIRYTPTPGDSRHRGKKAPNQPGKIEKVEGDGEVEPDNGAHLPFLSLFAAAVCASLWTQLS